MDKPWTHTDTDIRAVRVFAFSQSLRSVALPLQSVFLSSLNNYWSGYTSNALNVFNGFMGSEKRTDGIFEGVLRVKAGSTLSVSNIPTRLYSRRY